MELEYHCNVIKREKTDPIGISQITHVKICRVLLKAHSKYLGDSQKPLRCLENQLEFLTKRYS